MAVRKSKVKQWAMNKCYERLDHGVASTAAVKTGCNCTVVALSFEMYRTPRIIQVHKSNTEPIQANRGILAGCGYAVHYLKAMINKEVKDDQREPRDFVDDVVLFEEEET
eukprot:12140844-Heterocapsa_arctica.AAC.1